MNKLITKEDEDILSFFRTLDHMKEDWAVCPEAAVRC